MNLERLQKYKNHKPTITCYSTLNKGKKKEELTLIPKFIKKQEHKDLQSRIGENLMTLKWTRASYECCLPTLGA